MFRQRRIVMPKRYSVEKRSIPITAGKLDLLILRPVQNKKPPKETPGILWLHGGGYAVGMASMVFVSRALNLVRNFGAVVIAPEYRLAGRHPYPAALEDCHSALCYLRDHASELGCSPDRIMVGGESAGGGLTAALCMYEKDKGGVNIAFQMPLYPMIDNHDTDSSRNNHSFPWNTKRNHAAWKLYLRNLAGEIPAYAAPSRQTNYEKLPPAYTFVGNREPFYCETLTYIDHLKKAGIPASVDVYPTGFHAFDMLLPFRTISRQAIAAFEAAYRYAAAHYTAPQSEEGGAI